MADTTRVAGSVATGPQLRTCALCRQRKVKCDRNQPCSNCVRAGCECIYPTGRGRAPKRSRRAVDTQLVDKLARLETIIQRLASENASNLGEGAVSANPRAEKTPGASPPDSKPGSTQETPMTQHDATALEESLATSAPTACSITSQFGRLMIDKKKSYYVSNPLWATMAQEIDELRDILVGEEDEDDDNDLIGPDVSATTSNANAALFGYRAVAYSLRPYHLQLPQAVDLFGVYTENVAPILPIFHLPTLSSMYWDAIAAVDPLDKNVEAVVFAVYYSAIISMPTEQCIAILGLTREVAAERYRFAAEQAIARADLLNTQSMALLQAVVLFLSALRNQDDSRTAWSLTVLVFHIAQTMGLHRDGTVFGLKPFETELRRRLWWQICILESRAADLHGFGPIQYQFSSDTRMPLNVQESDLSPDMTEPPVEREEATNMFFSLVRCEAMRTAAKMQLLAPDPQLAATKVGGTPAASTEERAQLVRELDQTMRERYIAKCDDSSPLLKMAALLARLITVHFWLMLYYPLRRIDNNNNNNNNDPKVGGHKQPATSPSASDTRDTKTVPVVAPRQGFSDPGGTIMSRDQLFLHSIEILELSSHIIHNPAIGKFMWYAKAHVQWHVVAFVLSEICRRAPSPDCERAWDIVTRMYGVWSMHTSGKRGLMWKSVRRLMARAKYVREMQALHRGEAGNATGSRGPSSWGDPLGSQAASSVDPNTAAAGASAAAVGKESSPATSWSTPSAGSVWGVDTAAQLGFHQGVLGMDSDDPLAGLLNMPMDLEMDDEIFTTLEASQGTFPGDYGGGTSGVEGGNWATW